jgi:hypothetical protein
MKVRRGVGESISQNNYVWITNSGESCTRWFKPIANRQLSGANIRCITHPDADQLEVLVERQEGRMDGLG